LLARRSADRRLHLVADNTRFLLLTGRGGHRNPGSAVLERNLRRFSDDRDEHFGHRLKLADIFVNLGRFNGGADIAANWIPLGRSRALCAATTLAKSTTAYRGRC